MKAGKSYRISGRPFKAKISQAKRMYGLNKSYYKGFNGDRMWAALSIMATNIKKLLRDIDKNPKLMHRFGI